jgi:uncharacterized iron-regulated membrane protein
MRKAIFQVHLWCGVAIGLYAFVIGLSGAVLMFRQDLQAWAYPQVFAPLARGAALASPDTVVTELRTRFPDERFSGIDYPTDRRGTFLAYLTKGGDFRAVFLDPLTGRFSGELPKAGWIQQLQDLHFNLWSGSTGLTVNGLGALCLLGMALTGLVIAWPAGTSWAGLLWVDWSRGWKRVTWELHRAAGAWALLLLVMWAITGFYFAFPRPVRTLVNAILPAAGSSSAPVQAHAATVTAPVLSALVARAQQELPLAQVARVVVPSTPLGTYDVVMARAVHGDWDGSDEVTLHFDGTGTLVRVTDASARSPASRVITWFGLLHVGSFGGWPVKIAWALFALALPTLFASGYVMWWNHVVAPALRR